MQEVGAFRIASGVIGTQKALGLGHASQKKAPDEKSGEGLRHGPGGCLPHRSRSVLCFRAKATMATEKSGQRVMKTSQHPDGRMQSTADQSRVERSRSLLAARETLSTMESCIGPSFGDAIIALVIRISYYAQVFVPCTHRTERTDGPPTTHVFYNADGALYSTITHAAPNPGSHCRLRRAPFAAER